MSKAYKGQNCGNVLELTLQDEQEFKTPTIVWSSTTNGEIDQVQGDIPDLWKTDGGSGTQLTQIQIGSSCTSIGSQAFAYCYGFSGDLVIPGSVTNIGSSAFYYCDSFDGSLTIGNSVTSIEGYAFYSCQGFTGDLVIPNSVTSIGSYAFSACINLTGSLIIGNSVTSIGSYAFQDVDSSVRVIPDSVTSIGDYAFAYNFSSTIDYVGCPASSFTGSNAFYGCSLTTLYAKDAISNGYTLGSQTFQGKSLTIANWDNYPNPIPN